MVGERSAWGVRRAPHAILGGALAALLLSQCSAGPPVPGGVDVPGSDATSASPASATEQQRQGPLAEGSSAGSCVETYSMPTLVGRAFAFEGTVTEISLADLTDPEGKPLGGLVADVTFDVHEWFRGGSGDTVTVDMTPPVATDGGAPSERGPSYEEGTRLLVSGESRWGGGLSDAVAWGCGFSRYSSPGEAAQWRDAFATR